MTHYGANSWTNTTLLVHFILPTNAATFAGLFVHSAEVAENVTRHCVFVGKCLQDDHQLLLTRGDHAACCEAPHNPVHAAVHCTPRRKKDCFSAAGLWVLVFVMLWTCSHPSCVYLSSAFGSVTNTSHISTKFLNTHVSKQKQTQVIPAWLLTSQQRNIKYEIMEWQKQSFLEQTIKATLTVDDFDQNKQVQVDGKYHGAGFFTWNQIKHHWQFPVKNSNIEKMTGIDCYETQPSMCMTIRGKQPKCKNCSCNGWCSRFWLLELKWERKQLSQFTVLKDDRKYNLFKT